MGWLAALLLFTSTGNLGATQQAAVPPAAGDSAETHLGKGYQALKLENYDEAARQFQAALNVDPTLVLKARFPLAVCLFELHKTVEARQELEAVRRQVGDHPNVLYYLGRLDLEERKFDGAIKNLDRAAAHPPFPDTAYYLGFAYLQKGDLPSAEKWLKEAERLNPNDSRVPYQLAGVYRKQGRTEEASKAFSRSSELRQRSDSESTIKADCADRLGKGPREEAHKFCDQLYDPTDAKKLTALGTLYGQHGDPQAALKPLQRAAELEPQSPQTQYNLALTYYQLNRFEDARAPLDGALKRWPDLFELNSLYGAVLEKLGETAAAHEALRHAWQLNPQDSSTGTMLYSNTLELARKSADSHQYSECLAYLAEAAKLRPEQPEPHRSMAEIYTRMGQTDKAAAEQREADRLVKNSGN